MFDTFFATLTPMLVMFLCILTGFLLNKAKLTPDNTAAVLSKLENYVLVPALILNTFLRYCTVESIRENLPMILYCLVGVAVTFPLAIWLSKRFTKDTYQQKIYQYAMAIANYGFLGNAIVPQVLGAEALYTYMLFSLPINILCNGWGVNAMIPREKYKSVWKSILNPAFIATIIGIVAGLLGAGKWLPEFCMTTFANLGACMGPVAMVLTGFVIGSYNVPELLRNKKVYVATLLRLIVIPALVLALLYALGAGRDTLILAIFGFGTPLGMNTVIVPAAYGGETKTGAAMTMISHVACILTIPLLYMLLNQLV